MNALFLEGTHTDSLAAPYLTGGQGYGYDWALKQRAQKTKQLSTPRSPKEVSKLTVLLRHLQFAPDKTI